MIKILALFLGSQALFTFIQFLITRHDQKKGCLASIIKDIKEIKETRIEEKKDLLRMQLLSLIHICPDNTLEIMLVAEKYFKELKGDWYMSSMFRNYLNDRKLATPLWVKGDK